MRTIICLITLILSPATIYAQEELSVNAKADIVSDYVWRGMDQNSGASIQPSMSVSWYGFTLNAWGSQSLTKWENAGAKEFDINLSYTWQNLNITFSDYWWKGVNTDYGDYANDHYFEGTVSYCFGKRLPLTVSWSTMFAGGDIDIETGERNWSSYLKLSLPVEINGKATLTPSLGFTPWSGMYSDCTSVTDISLTVSGTLEVSKSFGIPMFVQAIVSPVYDRTYLVAGMTIGF